MKIKLRFGKKNEVPGILAWNCLEYVDVYGAAMKGGFITSPFSPRLKEDELDDLINYSETNTLFVGPELAEMVNSLRSRIPKVKKFISFEGQAPDMICHHELLNTYSKEEPEVQVEEDDPLFIFYTSGTTGTPRGALYNHSRAIDDTRTLVIGLTLQPGGKSIKMMTIFQ